MVHLVLDTNGTLSLAGHSNFTWSLFKKHGGSCVDHPLLRDAYVGYFILH